MIAGLESTHLAATEVQVAAVPHILAAGDRHGLTGCSRFQLGCDHLEFGMGQSRLHKIVEQSRSEPVEMSGQRKKTLRLRQQVAHHLRDDHRASARPCRQRASPSSSS